MAANPHLELVRLCSEDEVAAWLARVR